MGDCGAAIGESLERVIAAQNPRRPFTYLEIGVAYGQTMRAALECVIQLTESWCSVGVDIPDSSIFSLAECARNLSDFDFQRREEDGMAVIVPRHRQALIVVCNDWQWSCQHPLDWVLVDGCHCQWCVMRDFERVELHVRMGGEVCFHDTSERCQGEDRQPFHGKHCEEGINVRKALLSLGLLDGSREGWKLTSQVEDGNGCMIFRKAGDEIACA